MFTFFMKKGCYYEYSMLLLICAGQIDLYIANVLPVVVV